MFECSKNFFSYGIVQGRLTRSNQLQRFPQENWEQEFKVAKTLGFSFIELLTEREFNPNNPIWSNYGRNKIKEINCINELEIYSICSDYIINHSLFNDPNKSVYAHVKKLCEASNEIGCKLLVLPLLEESNLTKDTAKLLAKPINEIAKIAQDLGITISIESLMKSDTLINFLEDLNCENIKIVFDTGNRVLMSDDLSNEIVSLKKHINHIHIKDKNSDGNNVLLGTGKVNFEEIFNTLLSINYKDYIVFETTRGNNPIRSAKHNLDICNFFYENALND